MNIFYLLQTNSILLSIVIGVLGLCIGSFINVVIYRLPRMLQSNWKAQCQELLHSTEQTIQHTKFNLVTPRSRCHHCEKLIPFWHNIPIISFLLLKGKCAYCKQTISIQYLLVELLCAVLSVFIAYYFGFNWSLLGALLLTWGLLPLIVIDWQHQLLPDDITLPMIWLGLIFNLWNTYALLSDAVLGAVAGYLSLWLFTYIYKLITGKLGMGHGDFKLFALFGAWLGWQVLPIIIIFSAFFGAVIGSTWLILTRQKISKTIAFGPYLAIVGWFVFIFHNDLLHYYYLILG